MDCALCTVHCQRGVKLKRLKSFLLITIGFLFVAVALEFFLVPNKIAAGGVAGIAIIINNIFPQLPVGFLMLIMNLFLFIVAFLVIGNKFGAKSIYSSLGLSGVMWLMEKLPESIFPHSAATTDPLLAVIFGTLISGVGMAIVFYQNASTGGTDIIAKILNKFFHIDIGKSLLTVDFIVTMFCGKYIGWNIGMYALIGVIMNGFVIDNMIEGFNLQKQVMIVSQKSDDISEFIINTLNRGCTVLNGKGGFTGNESTVIYCVLGTREMIKLKKYIGETDRKAFITVSNAHEVLGEGFNDLDNID